MRWRDKSKSNSQGRLQSQGSSVTVCNGRTGRPSANVHEETRFKDSKSWDIVREPPWAMPTAAGAFSSPRSEVRQSIPVQDDIHCSRDAYPSPFQGLGKVAKKTPRTNSKQSLVCTPSGRYIARIILPESLQIVMCKFWLLLRNIWTKFSFSDCLVGQGHQKIKNSDHSWHILYLFSPWGSIGFGMKI